MELKVKEGDYLPDGKGGFLRSEGSEELLQRVLWKLSIRRGSFPPLPRLGSRLYLLSGEPPSRWTGLARQYVAEALAEEQGLEVSEVQLEENGQLRADLLWNGEALSIAAEVR